MVPVSLIQRNVSSPQFVFFRPPLLHKFELVWAYLLLPFGLWVDGNPLGTPELKNRSYLPLFFLSRRAALGSRPLDSIWRKSGPGSRALPKQRPAKRTHPNQTSTGEFKSCWCCHCGTTTLNKNGAKPSFHFTRKLPACPKNCKRGCTVCISKLSPDGAAAVYLCGEEFMQKSYDFVHHVLDPLVVGEVDHVLWNAKITVWGEVVRVPRQGDNTGMAL